MSCERREADGFARRVPQGNPKGSPFAQRIPQGNSKGSPFTEEQLVAIERRDGDLLVDAGAGSGKTSVLVERFARAVREDGVEVGQILTITFTEKAAAELRDRIRRRLRALGDDASVRATEEAWISTIHGFCARVLRANALAAGLDPGFAVLEATDAEALAAQAFDVALAELAAAPGGADLIATYGPGPLRSAIVSVHAELRSRGQRRPTLPPVRLPVSGAGSDGGIQQAREHALAAARAAAVELGALPAPSVRVVQALDTLERADSLLGSRAGGPPWPGDLSAVALPARNGAIVLGSDACDAYREALSALTALAAAGLANEVRDLLDSLLGRFADGYAALKAERSSVDFDDLELMARDLLAREEIGGRYRDRFTHVMVDELQDVNRVQLELIDLLAGGGHLFMVGDAQQSIYGFRHAEVELFEARGRALAGAGAHASLRTNFRTRPEVLHAINSAFGIAWGEGFRKLVPGRPEDPLATGPRVEMLVVDKGAEWEDTGLAAPWRLAEARVLAARVASLIAGGDCAAGDVVVLTRATTDLRAYERALEAAGVPTYVIGGRGYWGHPQVVEMVSYLRALANPRDEEAFYATLISPLCGLSLDGLVLVAAGARDELPPADAAALERFEGWFAAERSAAARVGVEELLDRAIARTGYDANVLRQPGGVRRLANVRKLMRLGREWEARAGVDLPGFLRFVELRAGGGGARTRESEAPVESEGLDAVRLMTIHRAKGLEFPVTCVADLGRGPTFRADLIRISRDGTRLGLRIGRPGTGARINALDYDVLREEAVEAEEAEERRLFYVAVTRARERLILSGAAKIETWEKGNRSTPIDWLGPAFVPDLAARVAGERGWTTELGVAFRFVSEEPERPLAAAPAPPEAAPSFPPPLDSGNETVSGARKPSQSAPSAISYSALAEFARCGYRYYVERVLGLPPVSGRAGSEQGAEERGHGALAGPALSGAERGTLLHAALQELDFARPAPDLDAPAEVLRLVEVFVSSPTRERLAAARDVRREQRFAFTLDGLLVTGVFDVLAREGDRLLVVDYKSDRLGGRAPETVVEHDYAAQRLIYALAALRAGAREVEVVHLFLEAPGEPAAALYTPGDAPALEAELRERAAGLRAGHFTVADDPHRGLCAGCPAAGGLCSWPLEVSMRPAVDRLF